MENVQGLHYRTKDGPTMQFWPARQHEFFQGPACNITPQSTHRDARPSFGLVDEAENLHNFPLSWDHIARLDDRNGDATGSKNWSHNWEWDCVRLTGHPASNGNNGNGHQSSHTQWGVREAEFSSPSPPEENGTPSEPTLLEFGLTSRTPPANEDDGLLDLKLGGNNHSLGAGELSPSLKRSRHSPPENQQTRCQVESCSADLQTAKDYHRRHKVCEYHAKAPNALVGTSLQRFCQQCSRFHLLSEFDDDRRSCRKRLAGHNRRRRKTQPDAATTLACLLADQSVLARIIGSSGQQQAKGELETLLQGNSFLQSLWTAKLAAEKAAENKLTAVESALPNTLINSLSKSPLLANLLLSNPTLGCTLPAMQAPSVPASAEALISALSNALLTSLPQLQQKTITEVGQGSTIPIQETGQPQEPYMSTSGLHAATKQNQYTRYSFEEHSGPLAFPSSMERPPQLPTTPPVHSDKSNNSNGDSMDERLHFDSCQTGSREGLAQQDRRHWKARKKTYEDTTVMHRGRNFQTAGANHSRGSGLVFLDMHTSPPDDQFETAGGLSDRSSDSGLDKPQEQTGSLWFKIFDKNPSDLPPSLRNQILEWLELLPTDMEGHIKPGCIILTILVCMPVYAWEKLCRNIERSLQKLVSVSDGDFWRRGRVLAHFGEASALMVDGKVYPNINFKPLQIPILFLVQPFAIVVGETENLILRGHNLKNPGTRLICAFEGKCIYKETDFPFSAREKKRDRHEASGKQSIVEPEVQQEQAVTFKVGPFNNIGRSIIEVERQNLSGNAVPIIIADKAVCDEINLLGSKRIESCENNEHTAKTSSSRREADITHFLHELGWLLQRGQQKGDFVELKIAEFSVARYTWLLRFSVAHSFCAVVGRILDILFGSDDVSTEHVRRSRALEVLSEANLLHLAVKNKSRAMVEFLMAYSAPTAVLAMDSKREYLFRPDTPIYDGFTPLHVAAGMCSADDIVDALTDVPEQLWATTWTSAKDSFGQTPLMYALTSGNHGYVKMVQEKLQKLGKLNELDTKRPHFALSVSSEDVKINVPSSPKKLPSTKQIQHCNCRARAIQSTQSFPLQIRGLNKGFMHRPLVISMLAVAAVCVCVGVLMRGSPSVSFVQGPFVWKNIRFGSI